MTTTGVRKFDFITNELYPSVITWKTESCRGNGLLTLIITFRLIILYKALKVVTLIFSLLFLFLFFYFINIDNLLFFVY